MISVKYLDNTKTLEIASNITIGTLQNKILNTFHLSVYDIKCILFTYINENYICGNNEMSFYSKFKTDNLIDIIVLDKNSTNIIPDEYLNGDYDEFE